MKRKKTLRVAMMGLSLALAAGLLVFAMVRRNAAAHRPPSPKADPVSIARFVATGDFAGLSDQQKAGYLQALRSSMPALVAAAEDGRLSKDEQKQAARNGFRFGARLEMSRYFTLPAGAARRAHLDRLINEQEQLRQYAQRVTGSRSPQLVGTPVEIKQFVESLAPEERIQMAQFAFDLFQRRRERGLPIWPYLADSGPGMRS